MNNSINYYFKNEYINNYIVNKQSIYNNIFKNKILKNKCDKLPKGSIEYKFLIYVRGEQEGYKNKYKPFVLPSSRIIANILKCSNTYVLKLLKKHSYLFRVEHNKLIWKWRNQTNQLVVDSDFSLFKINIYFFKTKWYKYNILSKRTKKINNFNTPVKINKRRGILLDDD